PRRKRSPDDGRKRVVAWAPADRGVRGSRSGAGQGLHAHRKPCRGARAPGAAEHLRVGCPKEKRRSGDLDEGGLEAAGRKGMGYRAGPGGPLQIQGPRRKESEVLRPSRQGDPPELLVDDVRGLPQGAAGPAASREGAGEEGVDRPGRERRSSSYPPENPGFSQEAWPRSAR